MRRSTAMWAAGAALGTGAVLAASGASLAQNPVRVDARTCTSQPGGAANVLTRAQAFTAALTPAQRQAVVYDYTKANSAKWSNLPVRMVPRNGVRFGDMNEAQRDAARGLIGAAMSSCGLALFDQIRAADGVLNKIDATRSWDAGNYSVAFVGAPSAAAPWILQVSGHHLAYNIAYNAPQISATPLFDGVEPVRFSADGRDLEPLAAQSAAMRALAAAIAVHPQAKLEGTFRDVTRGPGPTGDVDFPLTFPSGSTGRGVAYAALSADQKARVREAVRAWVELPNEAISSVLMREYTTDAALAQTFIGYSGATDLASPGAYVRIDGPRVWIELIVQAAVADPAKTHYHTIWRDKTADYGGAFKS